ncbi:hypothetical protein LEP1GSC052_0693 [Leptospira kmetyi serovar Malaysia str. Bejo-Iso9]|nr:hypothetical protein LEP1GSC052_0693 [Leptospira kmetyi serovar Malaysia str. Bejo-Iso9]
MWYRVSYFNRTFLALPYRKNPFCGQAVNLFPKRKNSNSWFRKFGGRTGPKSPILIRFKRFFSLEKTKKTDIQ